MFIVNFILVFAAIVLIHELGHFLAAKRFDIVVDKFSVGFGPRLFGMKRGGTIYQVALVPLGGYVKMDQVSHDSKQLWHRIIVALAGPAANLLIALLIFIGIFSAGVPSTSSRIGNLQPGKPAILAGVLSGDLVVQVNRRPVRLWSELIGEIGKSPLNSDLCLTVNRSGRLMDICMRPESKKNRAFIGIAPSAEMITQSFGIVESTQLGFHRWVKEVFGFTSFISGFTSGKSSTSDIGGPVAIASAANKAAQAGVKSFLMIIAILSISLGLFNLLPLPVLDGGTVLLSLVEAATKKKLSDKVKIRLNQAGIIGLSILMAWAFFNDFSR